VSARPDKLHSATFRLSERSLARLNGVHPDLVRVVQAAILISKWDFTVVEGIRTIEKQREYFNAGKSRTMKSRHLTGHAVDLMPYGDFDGDGDKEGSWEIIHFYPLNDAMQQASRTCNVPIVWGGTWASFQDCPHFELDRSVYP
jgi:peptidoglycan L-alanyl-D-glutamate endopeptidase CwlK